HLASGGRAEAHRRLIRLVFRQQAGKQLHQRDERDADEQHRDEHFDNAEPRLRLHGSVSCTQPVAASTCTRAVAVPAENVRLASVEAAQSGANVICGVPATCTAAGNVLGKSDPGAPPFGATEYDVYGPPAGRKVTT